MQRGSGVIRKLHNKFSLSLVLILQGHNLDHLGRLKRIYRQVETGP